MDSQFMHCVKLLDPFDGRKAGSFMCIDTSELHANSEVVELARVGVRAVVVTWPVAHNPFNPNCGCGKCRERG